MWRYWEEKWNLRSPTVLDDLQSPDVLYHGPSHEMRGIEEYKEAYQHLQKLQDEGEDIARYYAMVISDIEMPEMDGYQLTSAIRANSGMEDVYILLHSSISGVFNRDMVERTGANQFIQKYSANDLANAVLEHIGDSTRAS